MTGLGLTVNGGAGKMVSMDTTKATATDPAFWGAWVLLAGLVAIGVFDLIALFSRGEILSISSVIRGWASEYPIVSVAIGVIVGHLFFPSR